MKKLTLYFTIFISMFFIISNVKGATQSTEYEIITDNGTFTFKQQDLIDIDSNCTYGYVFIIENGTDNSVDIVFSAKYNETIELNENSITVSRQYNANYRKFRYNFNTNQYSLIESKSVKGFSITGVKIYFYSYYYESFPFVPIYNRNNPDILKLVKLNDKNYEPKILEVNNSIDNNRYKLFLYVNHTFLFDSSVLYYPNNIIYNDLYINPYFLYTHNKSVIQILWSDKPLYVMNEYIYRDSEKVNNNKFGTEYVFSTYDLYDNNNNLIHAKDTTLDIVPDSYNYENNINCREISKIEINFDIPINEPFNFDLDFISQFNSDSLAKPYLEYVDDFNNTTIAQIDDFIGEMEDTKSIDRQGNEIYEYSGHIGINFLGLNSLKIVIDVSNYGDYDYYLNLKSSINFNVNIINILDEIEYMTTIDLEGKYGIYLIPKTLNQDVFQNISLYGKYNIEVRKNYISEENYEVYKTYENYTNSNFQVVYSFLDLHYLIYFENVNYISGNDLGYYITFDNRYFNYALKEFSYSEPTIINPNTNEEINVKEKMEDINSNDIKGFIKSISYYIEQFANVIKYFFDSLPSMIRSGIVALFILLLIVTAILLGRGKK